LTWKAPIEDYGFPVQHYKLWKKLDSAESQFKLEKEKIIGTSYTVTGLEQGVSYTFTV
jgi:hypothetical protein